MSCSDGKSSGQSVPMEVDPPLGGFGATVQKVPRGKRKQPCGCGPKQPKPAKEAKRVAFEDEELEESSDDDETSPSESFQELDGLKASTIGRRVRIEDLPSFGNSPPKPEAGGISTSKPVRPSPPTSIPMPAPMPSSLAGSEAKMLGLSSPTSGQSPHSLSLAAHTSSSQPSMSTGKSSSTSMPLPTPQSDSKSDSSLPGASRVAPLRALLQTGRLRGQVRMTPFLQTILRSPPRPSLRIEIFGPKTTTSSQDDAQEWHILASQSGLSTSSGQES